MFYHKSLMILRMLFYYTKVVRLVCILRRKILPFGLSVVFLLSHLGELMAETRRYRLSWVNDPATSMSIGFEFYRGREVYVAYDTESGGGDPAAYRFKAAPVRTVMRHGMRNVFVRLEGLRPATVYHFMVVDDQGLSRPMSFETPPNRLDQPLSIVAGGDSRNHRDARCLANQIVAKLRPHAVVFSGDMTNTDTAAEWAEWLDDWQLTISDDGHCTPIVPARGNHEMEDASIADFFDLPNPKVYYALEFNGGLLRLYTLNSMAFAAGDQLNWLSSDLSQQTNVTWKMVQYHNTMRPHNQRKPQRDDLVKYWAPLFYRHGVSLVLESDSHLAKQTYPIRPDNGPGSEEGFIRDNLSGTVYIGEGGWGAPLRENDKIRNWTQASGSFNQFKWIWFSANEIAIRTVVIDNSRNTKALDSSRRFSVPLGISLWQPNKEEVLYIRKKGSASQINATASPSTPPFGSPRPQEMRPTPSPTPAPAAAPTAELPLRLSATGKVQVAYTNRQAGEVELIIITEQMKQFHKIPLGHKAVGPSKEWVNMPDLPRGIQWQVIIKDPKGVCQKYQLVN